MLGIVSFATPAIVLAPRLDAQAAPTERPSTVAVQVHIDTRRDSYHVGDSVAVRLVLTNTGPVPLNVVPAPPWYAVRLIVTGADGQVIDPPDDLDDRFYRTGRTYPLNPQVPDTVTYNRRQWTGLQHWGYRPLPPGQYTLTAIPVVTGYNVTADLETVRSNQVKFTVAP